ncbi:uncharacterized protein LOC143274696 [Babylonia areolata]|uniref:uncharacterized protein LOC143274696 n=1 Tax=Babylonia areolata TaxID=304850 RepID=UPI003FD28BD7
MEDHKAKHKHSAPSVQNLRAKQRETQVEIRKSKRDRKFNAKRVRLENTEGEEGSISLEETEAACRELVKKGDNTMECLLKLRRAFTQGPEFIDVLFRVDNCLASLVGLLTGRAIEVQEQVAWCMTNVATGRPEHVLALAKAAAPYCITYISGSSPVLQDQCAWALGNMAGDNVECRLLLHSMGCLPPLINLLQSPTPACVKSAAFAISNLIAELHSICKDAVQAGLLTVMLQLLQKTDVTPDVLSELGWVVTYLTNSPEVVVEMVTMGFLPVLVDIVVHVAMTGQVKGGEVATPMLRALGNVCCGPDEYSLMACGNPRLMPALLRLLQSPLPHVVKETVWVMSNMTSDYSVSQSVVYGPMLPTLVSLLDRGHQVQMETMYTLCNMASHGETTCGELVSHGAVAKVVPLLKTVDLELLHMALAFCEAVLRYSEDARFVFEECGGLSNLEQLQHHANSDIQSQAQELADTYFGDEAGDEYDD